MAIPTASMKVNRPVSNRRSGRRLGLTLLELLGVLVILSLVAGIGTVSLKHIVGRARIRHTVDRLQWLHESTRRLATSTQAEWQLEFQPEEGRCLRRRSGDTTATVVSGELQITSLLHTVTSRSDNLVIRYHPSGASDWCFAETEAGTGILLCGSTSQTLYPMETSDAKKILRETE